MWRVGLVLLALILAGVPASASEGVAGFIVEVQDLEQDRSWMHQFAVLPPRAYPAQDGQLYHANIVDESVFQDGVRLSQRSIWAPDQQLELLEPVFHSERRGIGLPTLDPSEAADDETGEDTTIVDRFRGSWPAKDVPCFLHAFSESVTSSGWAQLRGCDAAGLRLDGEFDGRGAYLDGDTIRLVDRTTTSYREWVLFFHDELGLQRIHVEGFEHGSLTGIPLRDTEAIEATLTLLAKSDRIDFGTGQWLGPAPRLATNYVDQVPVPDAGQKSFFPLEDAVAAVRGSGTSSALLLQVGSGSIVHAMPTHERTDLGERIEWTLVVSTGAACEQHTLQRSKHAGLVLAGPVLKDSNPCDAHRFVHPDELPAETHTEAYMQARLQAYGSSEQALGFFDGRTGHHGILELRAQQGARHELRFAGDRLVSHDVIEMQQFGLGETIPQDEPGIQASGFVAGDFEQVVWYTTGALALVALVVAALRYAPLVGLLTRARGLQVLDVDCRKQMVQYVERYPGCRLEDLIRDLGLGRGQADHHLRKLQQAGFIQCVVGPGFHHVFPSTGFSQEVMEAIPLLRNEGALRVMETIRGQRCSSLTVAQATGLGASTVSYHVKRLRSAGLLETERAGRHLHLRATHLGQVAFDARQGQLVEA